MTEFKKGVKFAFVIENGSRTGLEENFESAVKSLPIEDIEDKDAQAEAEELEAIANFTAQQVLPGVRFDLPLISVKDFERISRRFTKEPPTQDHGSKDSWKGEKSRDRRDPKPVLPKRRHIELELSF